MLKRVDFSKRERRISFFLVICVLAYILQAGVYKPLALKKKVLRQKIKTSEKRVRRAKRALRKGGDVSLHEKGLEGFKQKGTDEQVMSVILSEIEQEKAELDLRIADMKPQKARKVGPLNYFSVNLTLDGEIADIMQFIYILQNPPHMLYVDEFQLSRGSARDSSLKCQLVLSRRLAN
ncbi:MAG: hypothetical protein KAJ18_03410 [Candidatus Omnitrophica bacterium]|nr:hypothetical protein [Candidatus Omnitrophota bacterium]